MRAHALAVLVPLLAAALPMPATAASAAAWTADDAAGDADPAVANEWADLLHGDLDAVDGSLRLTLSVATIDPVPPAATAYFAIYEAGNGGDTRFCGMVQDRPGFLKFFLGGWDPARHVATDAVETGGRFVPGSPAAIRADCGSDVPSSVSFQVVDIKGYLLPDPTGLVLDEAAAAPSSPPEPAAAPAPTQAAAPGTSHGTPGLGVAALLGAVALALILRRRVA